MAILVWGLLIYLGLSASRLSWQAFAWILGLSIPAIAFQAMLKQRGIEALGEDGSIVWQPEGLLLAILINAFIWSFFYVTGFLIGRWRRSRNSEG